MDGVDTFLARYPDSPIALDVLGTLDADAIRASVRELEPQTAEVFFLGVSVGALFGLRLRDGSRVAVKVHKLVRDESYLDEVQRLQAALAEQGYPTPRPLWRRGLATCEEWLEEGRFLDAHDPPVRRAMAGELARLHRLATATRLRPRRELLRPPDKLWPTPHNVLFDFEATSAGAEWIDGVASAARQVDAEVGGELVGHTDWSAKHLRFGPRLELTALYDWDSVAVDREPTLVGTAAGSFTYTEELGEGIDLWPSTEESLAFVADYEVARGRPFDEAERRAAHAACVYLRAYAARCHHAYGGDARETGLADLAETLLSGRGRGTRASRSSA